MSDIIKLLPDSVANQIAAGEVIQRPASVIKELIENSVDAGATDIKVVVKDAGRTLIQVIDNGKGMTPTDARMAFERHATSKIKAADDLFTLHTMGFRGEALPSISAISTVEIKTRIKGADLGTNLVIIGSKVELQESCVCEYGTNIMVKNLFFNVPARRKFLKSDNVELSNIMREFERLALVNNHIRMSIDTGARNLDLRAGTLKQRIGDIWKNNLDLHLLPIEVSTSLIKISGFVSRPEFARRRNPLQFLIVNGRNMRHPYFHRAIMSCYEPLIAPETQPCYFLKFEVDPASIDVNIHPTKNEIKFEYENEIWPIIQASVKAALGKFGAVPSIDFNSDVLPIDPLLDQKKIVPPTLDLQQGYNPFKAERRETEFPNDFYSPKAFSDTKRNTSNWENLYYDFIKGSSDSHEGNSIAEGKKDESNIIFSDSEERNLIINSFCVQHALQYIITSSRAGLIIIDQHRAHVRILYDRYMKLVENGDKVSQGMMFPEILTLYPDQLTALKEVEEELMKLGFKLEYEEENRWKIMSIPVMLKNVEAKEVIIDILESVNTESGSYGQKLPADIRLMSQMALVLAKKAAIQGGTKLNSTEMEHLVGELFALPDPAYTPSGNPIYMILDSARLDSFFK